MTHKNRVFLGVGLAVSALSATSLVPFYPFTGNVSAQDIFKGDLKLVRPNISPKILTSTARMTAFDPERHGFRFINTFKTVTGVFDFTTGGLCGGMAWAALDYWKAGMARPEQNFTPVNGTTLQSYLYARTMTAIESHLDKYVELNFNPGGARNSEFFNWGLQGTGGGRLQELRAKIDAGEPVPLGLKSLNADIGSDHVVLAYGYDMGRYAGDMGANKEDLKIFIYEPNFGARRMTLIPKMDRQQWCYEAVPGVIADGEKCWQTYFVQQNYRPSPAPAIPAGPVKDMLLHITTGGDDLRGGNDNVDGFVVLNNGARYDSRNMNQSQRWIDNTTQTVAISLPASVRTHDISRIVLEVRNSFSNNIFGDNWNVEGVDATFRQNEGIISNCAYSSSREGTMRLTAQVKAISFAFPCGPRLSLQMRTGGDDLRGGNDNLDVEVMMGSGQVIKFPNVNKSENWPNDSLQNVTLPLPSDINLNDVQSVKLTSGGGGDNWNLDGIQILTLNQSQVGYCVRGNLNQGISLLHRFSGEARTQTYATRC